MKYCIFVYIKAFFFLFFEILLNFFLINFICLRFIYGRSLPKKKKKSSSECKEQGTLDQQKKTVVKAICHSDREKQTIVKRVNVESSSSTILIADILECELGVDDYPRNIQLIQNTSRCKNKSITLATLCLKSQLSKEGQAKPSQQANHKERVNCTEC